MARPYYGDRRDDLEALYPTSISFCTFHQDYSLGLIESISLGVVFLIAFWSGPAVQKFKLVCYALEDSVPWDRFKFHVIDTDGLKAGNPFETHESLGGYGEAFWIRQGAIVSSMGKEWSNDRFDTLTRELIAAQ